MFRHIVIIFLLLGFAAQIFNRSVIVLDYYTNTASFAKNCENKARPLMHCNGKCQMMKKLKEEEKKDQQNPDRKGDNKDQLVYFSLSFSSFNFHNESNLTSFSSHFDTSFPKGICADIFHPPVLV